MEFEDALAAGAGVETVDVLRHHGEGFVGGDGFSFGTCDRLVSRVGKLRSHNLTE